MDTGTLKPSSPFLTIRPRVWMVTMGVSGHPQKVQESWGTMHNASMVPPALSVLGKKKTECAALPLDLCL